MIDDNRDITFWFCGEPLKTTTVLELRSLFPHSRILNFYGPTETTVFATYFEVPHDVPTNVVPIGKPLPKVIVRLRSPEDACSEIIIGGEQVGTYMGVVETSAETRFLGSGEFLSGDVGRVDADGNLHFVDRIGEIVKIRGKRYALSSLKKEIGSFLGSQYCEIVENPISNKFVVFAVNPSLNLDLTLFDGPLELRQATVYNVQQLPMTKNGKFDRKAVLTYASHEL